jgi:hypothetical protein
MDTFLSFIESSDLSMWVRGDSMLAFPTIITAHTICMGLLAGTSSAIDLRILGVAPGIPLDALRRFYPMMWLALAINAVTGVLMVIGYPTKQRGAGSRAADRARNGHSTAPFAPECQSFLNNLMAGFGLNGSWNDPHWAREAIVDRSVLARVARNRHSDYFLAAASRRRISLLSLLKLRGSPFATTRCPSPSLTASRSSLVFTAPFF